MSRFGIRVAKKMRSPIHRGSKKGDMRELAGDGGFEPPLPDPETGVLPLD